MAQYTGISYNKIIVIAIIPVGLYFCGVFLGTHFEAKREGVLGVSKNALPRMKNLTKRLDLLLPLALIVGLLLAGKTPTYAALFAVLAAFVISFFRKDTRLSPGRLVRILEIGARSALPVICACASAGIIVGTVTVTGFGPKIAGGVVDLAGGVFFLVLFFTMIACLILGMGLPTTANYVVTASMAAPAVAHFGVPVIAVHMFVFYFGIVADITPPVCLAAYAGAGIAGANPIRTGFHAVKLAIAAFVIPYVFVYHPVLVLHNATVFGVVLSVGTAILGMVGISSGTIGYFVERTPWWQRILLLSFGVLLVIPHLWLSALGLVGLVGVGGFQLVRRRARLPMSAPM